VELEVDCLAATGNPQVSPKMMFQMGVSVEWGKTQSYPKSLSVEQILDSLSARSNQPG
jgi:hypothetical protein